MADGVEILIYSLELVAVSLINIFPYFTLLYHNECQSQTWRTAKTKEKSIVFFGKKCFQPKVSENLGPRCIYIFAFNVSYSAKLTLTIYRCNIYCFIMEMKKKMVKILKLLEDPSSLLCWCWRLLFLPSVSILDTALPLVLSHDPSDYLCQTIITKLTELSSMRIFYISL